MRVAIVCDKLTIPGGAEKVIEAWLELFPNADIYTVFYDPSYYSDSIISKHKIYTLTKLNILTRLKPFSKSWFRAFFWIYPRLIEKLNLRNYDLIISSHAVAAHGVLTSPKQIHIAYIHTPLRYVYEQKDIVNKYKFVKFIKPIYKHLVSSFIKWDKRVASRPDFVIVNSKNTYTKYIKHYKRIPHKIVYPPVEVNKIINISKTYKPSNNFYLVLSRLQEYKKIDVAIKTFNSYLPDQKVVIAGEGPEFKYLKKLAAGNPNIYFTGFVSEKKKIKLLSQAKALIFPGEEDFGIVMVESLAAGTPVIALNKGGAKEILNKETGILFNKQTPKDIYSAVQKFESIKSFNPNSLRTRAQKFSKEYFLTIFKNITTELLNKNNQYESPKFS